MFYGEDALDVVSRRCSEEHVEIGGYLAL